MDTTERPLSGKVALVTGGSRGTGTATARAPAADGAAVAISYTASAGKAGNVVTAIERAGAPAAASRADQSDPLVLVRGVGRSLGRRTSVG
ncbi:SDR family NAD(P)-dependent oxidoreductase [Actinomadura sp. NPDC047616]|uniref:SDR family NAD(P)-dependent oxidoreductase n=1 Tax=Actinomadura sp. NPDC047616 TaxID=3155914 RepID=UPI0033DADFA1